MATRIYQFIAFLFIVFGSVSYSIGTDFLIIPTNSRELTVGSHPLANFSEVNPAGLTLFGNKPLMKAAYGSWYSDVTQTSFGLINRTFGGTTGILIRYAGLNGLELRTSSPTDDPLAEFGTYGASIDLSHSGEYGEMKYGISIRHLQMQMHTSHSGGWAMDMGVLWHPMEKTSLGFSVLNLGKMTTLNKTSPSLPTRILIGGDTILKGNGWENTLMATVEYSQSISGLVYRIGNELHYRFLSLLLGSQFSDDLTTVSAGVQVHVGIYKIGYGVRFGSQGLGNPSMLDVSVLLP